VAAAAERRRFDGLKQLCFGVDFPTRFLRVGDDAEFLRIVQDLLHARIAVGAKDRVGQATFDECQTTADLVVRLVDAMTDHAGDAFARRRMAVEIRCE